MGTDGPSKPVLAEVKAKIYKLACRVFVFALPHSRGECTCAFFYWCRLGFTEGGWGGAALVAGTTFREFRSISLGKWRGFFGNESGGRLKNPRGLW